MIRLIMRLQGQGRALPRLINTYDSNASYELKGADSDISTLDVTKAVSDLDKDKVLQQYQRFVGSADVTVMQQAALNEQINRETENFIL